MNIDWFFAFISATSAGMLLFFPRIVLMLMYRISFGIFRLQRLEIPEHYRKDFELLQSSQKDFFIKYRVQLIMLRLIGMVAFFLFLASICIPPSS